MQRCLPKVLGQADEGQLNPGRWGGGGFWARPGGGSRQEAVGGCKGGLRLQKGLGESGEAWPHGAKGLVPVRKWEPPRLLTLCV